MATTYAAVHAHPSGPGDARPTALQIVQDEGLEQKLTGKVILITGCSSGIGIETARALSKTGARLYVTARNEEKAKGALGDLLEMKNVHLLKLDLNSLAGVRAFVKEFLSKSEKLNILINNAGVMATPAGQTEDGFETQFATNHLAPFLLFQLLKPALLRASEPNFASRVVMVSSSAHRFSEVEFDNINLEEIYDPWKAYGQSKTATIWTSNEIERRFGSRNLHAFSVHPGGISTGLQKHVSQGMVDQWKSHETMGPQWKNTEQGAATTVWAAMSKALEGRGGKYLEDCQIAGPWDPETGEMGSGYAPWVYNEDKAVKLWERSVELVGLQNDE